MLNSQIKFNKNISVTDSSIFLLLLRILDQKNKIVYFTENTQSSINLKNKIESVNSNVEILIYQNLIVIFPQICHPPNRY